MSTFGTHINVSIFGESHGPGVGITIHNLPAGFPLDLDKIVDALDRRRSKHAYSTARREKDAFEILSGTLDGKTTGAPLTFYIPNSDVKSAPYTKGRVRPGHADFAAYHKTGGNFDQRGGGHFSGRMTATLVILGEVSRQMLEKKKALVVSHLLSIYTKNDPSVYDRPLDEATIQRLLDSEFPVIDPDNEKLFKDTILAAKEDKDSVGGVVETVIYHDAVGAGEPFFDSFESILSHLLYSVPAVKGVSFGRGFDITRMHGSESNDPVVMDDNGHPTFTKNDMGGILGGIASGEPIIFKTAIKPTSSIGKKQNTVNLKENEGVSVESGKRHDPCIVPRALPVINAVAYFALLELTLRNEGTSWMN